MFKTFAILKVVSIANHQSHQITPNIAWTNKCIHALGVAIGTTPKTTCIREQILGKYKTATYQLFSVPEMHNAKSL